MLKALKCEKFTPVGAEHRIIPVLLEQGLVLNLPKKFVH